MVPLGLGGVSNLGPLATLGITHSATTPVVLLIYFEKILNDASPFSDHALRLDSFVTKVISYDQVVELVRPVALEEIKETFFRMKPGKAPGPDGFLASFY